MDMRRAIDQALATNAENQARQAELHERLSRDQQQFEAELARFLRIMENEKNPGSLSVYPDRSKERLRFLSEHGYDHQVGDSYNIPLKSVPSFKRKSTKRNRAIIRKWELKPTPASVGSGWHLGLFRYSEYGQADHHYMVLTDGRFCTAYAGTVQQWGEIRTDRVYFGSNPSLSVGEVRERLAQVLISQNLAHKWQ